MSLGPRVNRLSLSPDETLAYVADQMRALLGMVVLDEMKVRRWVKLPGVAFGTAPRLDQAQAK